MYRIHCRQITSVLLIVGACVSTVWLLASEASTSFPPRFAGESAPAPVTGLTTTSNRWSGYAEIGSVYWSMQGTWNVPKVSYAPGSHTGARQVSSTWIGIGGNGTTDNTLVQLGTVQAVDANGGTQYYAWYLFYNGLGHGITPIDPSAYAIQPGDTITATITCTGNCTPNADQTWQLTLNSSRWSAPWQLSPPAQYKDSLASAEWIMEAATVGGAISDMPNFTPVEFSNARANGAVPNFAATQAIAMLTSGTPVAEPSLSSSPGAFTVQRAGLPSNGQLPSAFAPFHCPSSAMLGEATQTGLSVQGTAAPRLPAYQQFYVARYSQLSTTAPPDPQRPYAIEIVDDLTGLSNVIEYFQNGRMYNLSVDPGFYCVRVSDKNSSQAVPFNFQLLAGPMDYATSPSMQDAKPLTLMDVGATTSNLYFGTRYLWEQSHPNHSEPMLLTPGQTYAIRDWVGMAAPDQWYRFTLDAPRTVNVAFDNIYLGANASLLDAQGNFVGATVYPASSSSIGPILPPQSYETRLAAGTYYIHIAFTRVGSPGTRFTLELTAQ